MSQTRQEDRLQAQITAYAMGLTYEALSPGAIRGAKISVIDTLASLVAGFDGEPCRIARELAARMPQRDGPSVIGTSLRTTPDMAAFVNATTARFPELTDIYHAPGSSVAHPSDVVLPILAAGELSGATGRDFITSIVLAYEICLRVSHGFRNEAADNTNLACLGSAVGAAKILKLDARQYAQALSMAVVPNNILKQARRGQKTMFKAVAAGQAGRAGVFAALLAQAGMEGAHLPFEGKAGWCDHVAGNRFTLDTFGGGAEPFRITQVRIKNRPAAGPSIAAILAAEKVAAAVRPEEVASIAIEVNGASLERTGTGDEVWNPTTRESADHSTPYLVAAALIDGAVTMRTFSDERLHDPRVRALMSRTTMSENHLFSDAYEKTPQEHRARVTVITTGGATHTGEAGGDAEDLAAPRTDAQIDEKFLGLTEETYGATRARAILRRLWSLQDIGNIGELPALLDFR